MDLKRSFELIPRCNQGEFNFKRQQVSANPGLQELRYEFTAEGAIGPEGDLRQNSFFGLDDLGRKRSRDMAFSLAPIGR